MIKQSVCLLVLRVCFGCVCVAVMSVGDRCTYMITLSTQGQLLVQTCDWVSKSLTRTLVAAVVVIAVVGVVAYDALL